ncbi:MAG: FAD-dependent oxidoreductase [bacterium]|nr:FAD-dependent oxidoreductase [bacterium]
MAVYYVRLIRQKEIAKDTRLFEFTKPKGFACRAGQSLDVVLNAEHPEKKMSQTFTIVSAPKVKTISVAMRMRKSAFKKKIGKLRVGDRVAIEGPFGSFTLYADETKPAVFIAGGIGITPFISILREIFDPFRKAKPSEITLFYSNRTKKDAAFFEELRRYAAQYKNFVFVPIFSALSGRISKKLLKKQIGKVKNQIFYIAGTLGFVTAMREAVLALGVQEDNIRTDEFPGY